MLNRGVSERSESNLRIECHTPVYVSEGGERQKQWTKSDTIRWMVKQLILEKQWSPSWNGA